MPKINKRVCGVRIKIDQEYNTKLDKYLLIS